MAMPSQPPQADKSVGVAFVLTVLFGPFGMLYAQVRPAVIMLIMLFIGLALAVATAGVSLILVWITSIFWGCAIASNQHSQYQSWLVRSQAVGGGSP
ncbi:MAG TPA: hypothetical protein VK428_11675 [Acidimicrobiales bacterium]|nr:hypothetical protein [Acidimicrobiales bacterium]